MLNSNSTAAQATTAPMSVLRLIANDAEFRAKVEADPVAAFAEHGIHLSSAPETVTLPDLESTDDIAGPPIWRGLL